MNKNKMIIIVSLLILILITAGALLVVENPEIMNKIKNISKGENNKQSKNSDNIKKDSKEKVSEKNNEENKEENNKEDKSITIDIGKEAPDFKYKNSNGEEVFLKDLNGKEVSLKDYKGKYLFVNFWATWCEPCREEMPDLNKFYLENRNEIEVLAINIGEEKTLAEEFIQENEYRIPVLLDEESEIASKYGVALIPMSFIIGPDGKIKAINPGVMTYDQMKESLRIVKQ
ncbi:hypothetical protein CLPU_2c02550 [Gottschalkia purinilytica]|uniref:Thioredoxin domain-containing protein n=1 Tax=Gottschalkia purinilytica TaxID=1503 RepID=A0A0L0WE99_GOTPU|nr:TlpA disulfide reductase family protein [Gottschalkia purinilytica]KNF09803.1 hypothetical protein CLPU_2c02550 [Gottschalkia purinilytica]